MTVGRTRSPGRLSGSRSMWDTRYGESYHVALVHLGTHGELDDEPGGVAQDEGGDEVPVDDVPQAADAPARPTEGGVKGGKLLPCCKVQSFFPFNSLHFYTNMSLFSCQG